MRYCVSFKTELKKAKIIPDLKILDQNYLQTTFRSKSLAQMKDVYLLNVFISRCLSYVLRDMAFPGTYSLCSAINVQYLLCVTCVISLYFI